MALSRMFSRKQTQSYYVKLEGNFVPLGRDKRETRERYRELLPVESRGHAAAPRSLSGMPPKRQEVIQQVPDGEHVAATAWHPSGVQVVLLRSRAPCGSSQGPK